MRRALLLLLATTVLVVASGCSGDPSGGAPEQRTFGGDRPTTLVVPSGYDHGTDTPLLLALHGYGSSGTAFATATGLLDLAEAEGFLLLAPDGTPDRADARFWNATEACCNFGGADVDDVAYLTGLVDEVAATFSVDRSRVHVMGFSNGAFMAHRLACERPDLLASVVAIAGSIDPARSCDDGGTASILSVHGTEDRAINYDGGAQYPSASGTTEAWAGELACGPAVAGATIDLDTSIPGAETTSRTHPDCRDGATVGLWSVEGADHGIALAPEGTRLLWEWLAGHAVG